WDICGVSVRPNAEPQEVAGIAVVRIRREATLPTDPPTEVNQIRIACREIRNPRDRTTTDHRHPDDRMGGSTSCICIDRKAQRRQVCHHLSVGLSGDTEAGWSPRIEDSVRHPSTRIIRRVVDHMRNAMFMAPWDVEEPIR